MHEHWIQKWKHCHLKFKSNLLRIHKEWLKMSMYFYARDISYKTMTIGNGMEAYWDKIGSTAFHCQKPMHIRLDWMI